MQFSKMETISVKSNEQSAQQSQLQTVFKMSIVTFFLTKHFNQNTMSDNHAVLIK